LYFYKFCVTEECSIIDNFKKTFFFFGIYKHQNMSSILKEGYCEKRGGGSKKKRFPSMKNWHLRWLVLVPGTLYYYDTAGDKDAKGSVELKSAIIDENPEDLKTDREFCVIVSSDEYEFVMSFYDQAEKEDWLKNIKAEVGHAACPPPVTTIPKQSNFDKFTKKVAGNAAIASVGKALIKEFIDDETQKIINTMQAFVIKEAGREKAMELEDSAIKTIVKIGLLVRNQYLDIDTLLRIRVPAVNLLFLAMDYYEMPDTFSAENFSEHLNKLYQVLEKMLHGLMRPKSLSRLKSLFEYFTNKATLTKAYRDPNFKKELDDLYKMLKHLHEENLI